MTVTPSDPVSGGGGSESVWIDYTNYRGERSWRHISPATIVWSSNEWHPEPQWLMYACDHEKNAERIFAMRDIHTWSTTPASCSVSPVVPKERWYDVLMSVASRLELPRSESGPPDDPLVYERAIDGLDQSYIDELKRRREAEAKLFATPLQRAPAPDGDVIEALRAADDALAQFTAFELDARSIMGNTNFEIVKHRREQVRAALSRLEASQPASSGSETFETIAQWCEETFGPITPERIAERANEEMIELLAEPSKVEEAADVVIVLSRYPDLWATVARKMAVNRQRQWRLMGDGTGYHVKAASPLPDTPPADAGLLEALRERDAGLEALGGCGDGYCIIHVRGGVHTNGGCRCSRDGMKMQRFAHINARFAKAVDALARASSRAGGQE